MRYGIISDIHGNLEALRAVLERLGDVDKLICPGDIVGYGPDPNECCSIVMSLECETVLGNHDAAVADRIGIQRFNRNAKLAALWTRDVIDEGALNFLAHLPATCSREEFVLVHASLKNPLRFPYVSSAGSARECFEEMSDHALCFIGHSHISEVYVQKNESLDVDRLDFRRGGTLDLRREFRYIVNCGSVGQPRDGNPDASCGVYDSEADTVEIVRVPYDIAACQDKMRKAELPEFLIERLDCGV